jgi:hypothetical protein
MISVIKIYSCGVIAVPEKNCLRFKKCLKNGRKGNCLLTEAELEKEKRKKRRYIKRIQDK